MTAAVRTSAGRVTGVVDRGTHVFGGIPYAEPPVGGNRFRPPARRAPWDGDFDAAAHGPAVPQRPLFGAVGELFASRLPQDEDCLRVAVRTPEPGDARLPVFVWLHGGGFAFGAGGDPIYQGGSFAQHGVVEVAVNYRLGAHGFALVDDRAAGRVANLGLLDQIAALTWVQENIAAFGGDPSRVTLAGHSAGAMSVACLLASPLAEGLFHQAVVQSATAPLAIDDASAAAIARLLAERLGIPDPSVEALASVPTDRLLDAQGALSDELYGGYEVERFGAAAPLGMPFVPVVDGHVLPSDPIARIASGAAAGIPMLAGSTRDEVRVSFSGPVAAEDFDDATTEMLLSVALARIGVPVADVVDAYRTAQPGRSLFGYFVAAGSDLAFRLPTTTIAAAAAGAAEAFVYRFDEPTRRDGLDLGAIHGAELAYTFANCDVEQARLLSGDADRSLVERVHRAWVEFCRSGRPSAPGLPAWPAFSAAERSTMLLSAASCAVAQDPGRAERLFWERALAAASPGPVGAG